MTSIPARPRQLAAESSYYINLGSLFNKVYAYDSSSTGPRLSTATWAGFGQLSASKWASTLNGGAGTFLLRDQGKTVVSASRTFRKVQLVTSTASTFGVQGVQGTTPYAEDYLTGYIELGNMNGSGADINQFAPVAKYGV